MYISSVAILEIIKGHPLFFSLRREQGWSELVGGQRWKSGGTRGSPWLVTDSRDPSHADPFHSMPLRPLTQLSIPIQWEKGGRQSSSPPSLWPRINALFKSTCFFSSSRPLVCPLPPFFPIRGEWFECRGEIGGAKAGGERGLPIPGGRLEVSPCPPANVALCHFFIHSWFCGRLAWRIRKNSSTPRLPLPPSSTEFRPLCRSTDSFALSSCSYAAVAALPSTRPPPWKASFFLCENCRTLESRWCYFIICIVLSLIKIFLSSIF